MIEIVMAAYNGEKYIEEQVESILENTVSDIKLSIYDDGSKDSTPSIIGKLQEKHDGKIAYHRNETNRGVILNFLHGVKSSTAKYIMLSDQDDVWNRDKIEKTLIRMQEMEKRYGEDTPIVVFTDSTVVDEQLQQMQSSFHRSNHLDVSRIDISHLLMENKLNGCTIMLNEALRKRLTTLPEHAKMHDWWLALIAASFGKISYINEPTMLYRQHRGNVVGNQNFTSYIIRRFAALREQRRTLRNICSQADDFLQIYREELDDSTRRIVTIFANLYNRNIIYRKYAVIRYGFLKTGIVRNIGVLLVV